MGFTETEAVVLRSYNLAEADRIVLFLTRDAGMIRGVARGSRRIKNRFGAALEPFTFLNISYHHKENQELVSLGQAEIVKSYFDLSRDPAVLAGLAYMGDLIVEFSPPHQTNEKLFRMVKACLNALEDTPTDLQLILRYFEIWLLRLEGFLPDLRRCGECQKGFTAGVTVFVSSEPGLLCPTCAQGKGEVLSSKTYSQLCATQKLSPAVFALEARGQSVRLQRELAELTHRMIGRALDRRPRLQPILQPMRPL
jgi:DNA repair protein RecO (recombination protein O)